MTDISKLSEYRDWLRDLKQQIKTGQIKAALSVNSQMIMLYWDMGRQIVEKQEKAVTNFNLTLPVLQSDLILRRSVLYFSKLDSGQYHLQSHKKWRNAA